MRLGLNAATTALIARQNLQVLASTTKDATFRLPSGRLLGYAEYGTPTGTPVFLLHGFPSSRLESGPLNAIARRNNIRLIALDRPGFGLSTPQTSRTIPDFASDIAVFAHAMKIRRFVVAGFSGGGPYALACAHAMPRSTLGAVGLFASAPPWVTGTIHHMSRPRRVMRFMALYWPAGLRVFLDGLMSSLRWVSGTRFVIRKTEEWLQSQDRKQAQAAKDTAGALVDDNVTDGANSNNRPPRPMADRRRTLFRILDEPFRQGASATVHETKLLTDPSWGFPLEGVAYQGPVRIWHGAKDVNAPIEAIRHLADKVPGAVLTEYPEDTHYTMGPRVEGALRELVEDYEQRV
ncbi:non-heme chloroperoxidase [Microdochium nivale]|nr:non-heme chloroperoxidase [Microdochium nivale]